MNHSTSLSKEDELQKNINAVSSWYRSFIPLILASILFVFCFIFESNLLLYLIMAFFFIVFIFLYVNANKQIIHKDGYTLIQAMSLYQQMQRASLDESLPDFNTHLLQFAKQYDYAETLQQEQLLLLYQIGKDLTKHLKIKN